MEKNILCRMQRGGRFIRCGRVGNQQEKPPSAFSKAARLGIEGPTLKDLFDVTRRYMPPTDIVRLLDMVVVNVLACNTDAHSKNYAIMLRGSGASLAPMYDVMCGEVWQNVTKNFAQKIAGKSRGDDLKGREWQRFGRECGLNPRQVLDRVGALAKSAITEVETAKSRGCRDAGRPSPHSRAGTTGR
jgi:serine/threonine-protein kinase HipA